MAESTERNKRKRLNKIALLTVYPPELYQRLSARRESMFRAGDRRASMAAIVRQAVTAYLDSTEAPNEIRPLRYRGQPINLPASFWTRLSPEQQTKVLQAYGRKTEA